MLNKYTDKQVRKKKPNAKTEATKLLLETKAKNAATHTKHKNTKKKTRFVLNCSSTLANNLYPSFLH